MPSKYKRKSQKRNPLKKIVIAMEGNITEPGYFNAVKKKYQAPTLIILKREKENTRSAPSNVLDQIKRYKKNNVVDANDEFWLVIDKDRWTDKQLNTTSNECRSSKCQLALSNPCFEIWLILHFDDLSKDSGEIWSSAKAHDKWNSVCKNKKISSYLKIVENIKCAVENSEKLDIEKEARWNNSLGTRVYKLAISILENT